MSSFKTKSCFPRLTKLYSEIAGVKSDASLYTTRKNFLFFFARSSAKHGHGTAIVVFGVVKLVASFCCAFFLVDVLGRKRCVFIGLTLQTIAALYLTIFVALVDPDNADGFVSESRKRASDGAWVASN